MGWYDRYALPRVVDSACSQKPNMRRRAAASLFVLLLVTAAVARAAESDPAGPKLDLGGLLFGDVYAIPHHHLADGDGSSGAVLRRAYLTFNAIAGTNWTGRLRFETNQSGAFETYTFSTQVKDFYVGRALGQHQLLLGLQPTLTYDLVEACWGARYLARTPLDLQGIASRDTGLSLRGPLSADKRWAYRAMYGSRIDWGSDGSDRQKYMAAVSWRPSDAWLLDFYADREPFEGPRDRRTWQVFAAYRNENLRWGFQYSYQDRQDDPPLELASSFLVKSVTARAALIGRVDRLLEPSPRGDGIAFLPMDPTARATVLFAGVELRLSDWLRMTPNLVRIAYDRNAEGIRPETDLHLRLTLFADFE